MSKNLSIVVAVARNLAIGNGGDLLCHLSADLKHFKAVTMGGTVIMGRRTWQSLPKGALPGRRNIVITRDAAFDAPGAEVATSLDAAISLAETDDRKVFIIGGGKLYASTIEMVDTLYLTVIEHEFPDADTFFPAIDSEKWEVIDEEKHEADEKNRYPYTFKTLRRR